MRGSTVEHFLVLDGIPIKGDELGHTLLLCKVYSEASIFTRDSFFLEFI